jgi:ribosome-associated toxin RatA of RatAB toxin-antitoxin module
MLAALLAPAQEVDVRAARRSFRMFARGLSAVVAAAALATTAAVFAAPAIRSVEVRTSGEGYALDLVMWVPAPPEVAFGVMVDFEHMPDWVPNLREVRVLKREPHRVTVEHRGVVRFGFLNIPFTTRREIDFDAPSWMHTVQVEGTLRRHESHLRFAADGPGTRVDYHVEMVPGALAALVMNESSVESELRAHFEAIAAEVTRRQEQAAPPSRRSEP